MTGTNVNFALFCRRTVYNMLLYTVLGKLYWFCMMFMIRGCVLNHAKRWLASSWGVIGWGVGVERWRGSVVAEVYTVHCTGIYWNERAFTDAHIIMIYMHLRNTALLTWRATSGSSRFCPSATLPVQHGRLANSTEMWNLRVFLERKNDESWHRFEFASITSSVEFATTVCSPSDVVIHHGRCVILLLYDVYNQWMWV